MPVSVQVVTRYQDRRSKTCGWLLTEIVGAPLRYEIILFALVLMSVLANCVKIVHVFVVAFFVLVPIVSNNELLLTYHFLLTPMLMLHWMTNNNVCALTQLEAFIRGTSDTNETFLGQFINPVYDLKDEIVWLATGLLWLLTALKLSSQYQFRLVKNIFSRFTGTSTTTTTPIE